MFTSPKEVEIVRSSEVIRNAYEAAFEKRYKTRPFVEVEDLVVFSFLSKNFGLERGSAVAAHYLLMEDEWFIKNAHSPSVLRKNINKVIADFGVKEARKNAGLGSKSEISIRCDLCGTKFLTRENIDDPDVGRDCPSCVANPKSIAEVEAMIAALPGSLGGAITDIFSLAPDKAARLFGKLCNEMIIQKMNGELPADFDWTGYSNTIGYAARLLTQRRKEWRV